MLAQFRGVPTDVFGPLEVTLFLDGAEIARKLRPEKRVLSRGAQGLPTTELAIDYNLLPWTSYVVIGDEQAGRRLGGALPIFRSR